MRAELRDPDRKPNEIWIWSSLEERLFDFGRPPKTFGSSRAQEHDDAGFGARAVEIATEGLQPLCKRGKGLRVPT